MKIYISTQLFSLRICFSFILDAKFHMLENPVKIDSSFVHAKLKKITQIVNPERISDLISRLRINVIVIGSKL